MAKYKNEIPGSWVTVNHKGGHTRIAFGEVKDLDPSPFVDGLVKRGKLSIVEADKPAKPQAPKKAEVQNTDKSNQS